jgi:Domain of unknown function (DUF4112)
MSSGAPHQPWAQLSAARVAAASALREIVKKSMIHVPKRDWGETHSERRLRQLNTLSHVLDNAIPIPGTRWRVGLDSLVGFIPGVGDLVGAGLAFYIIFEAARLGCPTHTLLRMVGNVGIDTLLGTVPILGDLFDIGWKANVRNVALLRAQAAELGQERQRSSRQLRRLVLGAIL